MRESRNEVSPLGRQNVSPLGRQNVSPTHQEGSIKLKMNESSRQSQRVQSGGMMRDEADEIFDSIGTFMLI